MKIKNNLKKKDSKAIQELLQQISKDPTLILSLITKLSDRSTVRFKAAKNLQLISRTNPALLYPHFEVFAKLLDNPSSVLLWNGIIILSYLVKVDESHQFDRIFVGYYRHLWDGKLVTAANILASSGRIARYRPDLADRITAELLKVDDIPLPTPECREVARGHVLASFTEYPEMLKHNLRARDFISRCTASHRPAVKEKTEELIRLVR